MHRSLLALLALGLLASAAPAQAAVDVPALWSKKCQSCHGVDGKADTTMGKKHKVKDISTAEWQEKESDDEIRTAIENGVKDTKMQGYKGKLSDEEIAALVAHIRTLKK